MKCVMLSGRLPSTSSPNSQSRNEVVARFVQNARGTINLTPPVSMQAASASRGVLEKNHERLELKRRLR